MTVPALWAQERVDTIYNPPIVYTGLPNVYEIADIKVTGADNYEDYIVIGYSGLKKGDKIEIPGNDVTTAVKRLMRQVRKKRGRQGVADNQSAHAAPHIRCEIFRNEKGGARRPSETVAADEGEPDHPEYSEPCHRHSEEIFFRERVR